MCFCSAPSGIIVPWDREGGVGRDTRARARARRSSARASPLVKRIRTTVGGGIGGDVATAGSSSSHGIGIICSGRDNGRGKGDMVMTLTAVVTITIAITITGATTAAAILIHFISPLVFRMMHWQRSI